LASAHFAVRIWRHIWMAFGNRYVMGNYRHLGSILTLPPSAPMRWHRPSR
jgi:hypothetical protein